MQRLFPENSFVPPAINEGTRLVIAEAPGEVEAAVGEPLVGPTGSWLRGRVDERSGEWRGGLFAKAGVRDKEVSRCNTIQCRPLENVYPTDPEARSYISKADAETAVEHCFRAHVSPLLHARNWSRIDLLGDKALRIVGGKDGGILRWRGSPISIPDLGPDIRAVPTLHPAGLARNQSLIPVVISDLKKSLVLPPENYNPHPSLEEVREFQSTRFAFDIETDIATGKITCVGFTAKSGTAICVPYAGAYLPELRRIFAVATEICGHNCLQFDMPHLREQGIRFREDVVVWDTMLLQHLLQPDLPHDLGFLGSVFTNKPAWKHLSGDDNELYCCRDTDVTWQCFQQLVPLCRAEKLLGVYERISRPLAAICLGMHQLGIQIDPTRIGVVREKLIAESSQLETKLPDILRSRRVATTKRELAPAGTLSEKSGKPLKYIKVPSSELVVPWRSPDALGRWLYEDCALPEQLHPKSAKRTSDKTALAKLEHRLAKGTIRQTTRGERIHNGDQLASWIRAVQKLRKLDELLTTFCKEEMLSVERVYPHFNVHGTSSGRLSSSEPNLQNIPESARYIYVPSHPTWRFLEVDYSQLENRLTAYFAGDTQRQIRLSQPGFSEHKWLASEFFAIPYEEVEKDNDKDAEYGKAKRIGHGTNYGMGARKIAQMYDMDLSEVKRLLEQWKVLNAPTVAWQLRTAELAKSQGFLTNPFRRRRWFYCLTPDTKTLTSDLRWVELGSLKIGDELIGFDEESQKGKGYGRKLRRSTVLGTGRRNLESFKLITDQGTVTASAEHPFLVDRKKGAKQYIWKRADALREGDKIAFLCKPWEQDRSNEAGWLAGFLDGEGSIGDYRVTFAQKPGKVLDYARDWFTRKGYVTRGKLDKKGVFHGYVATEFQDSVKLIGSLRPIRLVENSSRLWEGHRIWGRHTKAATVLNVIPVGLKEVVTLETSTHTIIANGLLSHNTDSYYTESLSFLPQSTGADIMHRAAIALSYNRIGLPLEFVAGYIPIVEALPEPARILLQVHDSFLVEGPGELMLEVARVVNRVLTQPWPELGGMSIPVEMKLGEAGQSWGELEPLDLSTL